MLPSFIYRNIEVARKLLILHKQTQKGNSVLIIFSRKKTPIVTFIKTKAA